MKVTKDRIYEQDLFEPLKKMARESAVDLGKMDAQTKLLSKSLVDLSKKFDGTAKSQRALIDADNASKKAMQDKIALDEKQIRLKTANERLTQAELRTKKMIEDQDKRNAKAQRDLNSEYSKQSKRLNDLRKEYKDLILTQGKETAETIRLKKEIISLDATLKKVDATVGQHQRSVGNYQKALGGVRNALMQLGVGFGVFQILRDTFGIISENDDAMASLSAITGLTGEKFEVFKTAINDVATELNVSSTEVAQAAEKIASAQPALLDNADALAAVTKEAITLNRAIKGDLTETSLALVGVMNQFGKEASEAASIINILAAGSQAGAASVNQINESIVKFGTTADLMNITVEESVGLIETLGEKAIFGADAGTALRNILLKMASIDVLPEKALKQLEAYGVNTDIVKDKSLSFEERLRELSKIAKDSTAIMQIFGTENATAATVLLNNLDTYGKMTAAVTDTNIATEQAAINQNTLSAVIEELRATWENLVIEFSSGTDVLGGLKAVLRFITANLETIIKVLFAGLKAWLLYRAQVKLFTGEINKATGVMKAGLIPQLWQSIKAMNASLVALRNGTIAVKSFGAALKSIPFVAIIAGLWDLISVFSSVDEETEQLTEDTGALADATKSINEQHAREKIELISVFNALKKTTAGTEERQNALDATNSKYGTTLKNLSDEKDFVNQLDVAYQELLRTLKEKIRFEIAREKMVPLITRQLEIEEELAKIEGELSGADRDDFGRFASVKMDELDRRRISLEFELTNIERTLRGIETGPLDMGVGSSATGSVDAEKKKLEKLSELRRQHADELVLYENEAIKAGYDRATVDEILFLRKKEQLKEELALIEELNLKTRDEYNKTENTLLKLTENEGKRLEKSKTQKIEALEDEKSFWKTVSELGAEAAKKMADAQKEALEAIYDTFKEITDLVAELIDKNASKIDQQIARQQMIHDGAKDREAELRRIAEERKLNADESIEAEREAQKKALVEIERLESKKRQLEMIVAAMKLLADGKSVADIKNSITDITSFAKANAAGSFYEGTDTTVGAALGHNNVKDGHLVNVDDKEAIFNPGQTAALDIRPGGNTTQDIVDAFKHVQGIADAKLSSGISGGSFAENIYSSAILNQMIQLNKKIEILPDNMPVSDLGFNAHVGALEFERKTRLRTEKVRYNIRKK